VGRGRLILTATTFRFFVVLFFSSSVYRTLFFLRGTRTFNHRVQLDREDTSLSLKTTYSSIAAPSRGLRRL